MQNHGWLSYAPSPPPFPSPSLWNAKADHPLRDCAWEIIKRTQNGKVCLDQFWSNFCAQNRTKYPQPWLLYFSPLTNTTKSQVGSLAKKGSSARFIFHFYSDFKKIAFQFYVHNLIMPALSFTQYLSCHHSQCLSNTAPHLRPRYYLNWNERKENHLASQANRFS